MTWLHRTYRWVEYIGLKAYWVATGVTGVRGETSAAAEHELQRHEYTELDNLFH